MKQLTLCLLLAIGFSCSFGGQLLCKTNENIITVSVPQISAKDKNENDVKGFIYQWFSWFDHQVPEEIFLAHLDNKDLLMKFPEKTLRNEADFKEWYTQVRKNIKSNTHGISDIKITKDKNNDFNVSLLVDWKATGSDNKDISMKVRQTWHIKNTHNDQLKISRYIVDPL